MKVISNSKDRWILIGILLSGAIALFAKSGETSSRSSQ
jgi:hypothetical protein